MSNELSKDVNFTSDIVEFKNKCITVLKKVKDVTPEILEAINKSKYLTIEFSPETMKAYNEGKYQLMEQLDGTLKAIMVDKNNHKRAVEIGNIKAKEMFNISPQEIVMQTMLMEIKGQLQLIIDNLDNIADGIKEIHQEQLITRDAKCSAAISLYNEYLLTKDEKRKELLLVEVSSKTTEAYEELKGEIDELIKYLNRKYDFEHNVWIFKDAKGFEEIKSKVIRLKAVLVEFNKMAMLKYVVNYETKEDNVLKSFVEYHKLYLLEKFDGPILRMVYNGDEESNSITDNEWINLTNSIPVGIIDSVCVGMMKTNLLEEKNG